MSTILSVREVVKRYDTKLAVDHISLDIPEGSVLGLLGPNGAGKTSLIRMITHITMPDEGAILFRNEELSERHQHLIGYMPEERGLYPKMKVFEQLEFLLRLKGQSSNDARTAARDWLQKFDLWHTRNQKVNELSKGMQQKVQFIATVAHKPPVLILDEPMSGLDPINAQLLEETIQQLAAEGSTVIFSTHRMEQVEKFCSRIALVNNGKLILDDDVKAVRMKYRKPHYILETESELTPANLPAGARLLEKNSHRMKVDLGNELSPKAFLHWANDQYDIVRFELDLPDLRQIFIEAVAASNAELQPATR